MLLEVCSGFDLASRTGYWASTLCCAALSVQGLSVLMQVRTICPPEMTLRPLYTARALHLLQAGWARHLLQAGGARHLLQACFARHLLQAGGARHLLQASMARHLLQARKALLPRLAFLVKQKAL